MDRKLDLWIDCKHGVHHVKQALVQQLLECRELEILCVLYGVLNTLQNRHKFVELHDVVMGVRALDTISCDEAMLAGEIAGRYGLNDNMFRILQYHMAHRR